MLTALHSSQLVECQSINSWASKIAFCFTPHQPQGFVVSLPIWEFHKMELTELSAVGLTFLLKLLVIWARHHCRQMQGTNYCSDMMDGYGFMFGCICRAGAAWGCLAGGGKPTIAR